MMKIEILNGDLNQLTVYQLRNLQHAVNKKLKEKTSSKIEFSGELLTDEELDMLSEVMKN
ncbi:hypothetical protein [Aliivibrio finisterrensis]|uniref:Uncharacterized protein n=1 Tax=Aliivibrio finisterrensis TaxID=511998 RepID=A0A6N6RVT9_9GAMM|nr:hypothetical protein [Aliivibrio finisterrensis]KAB2825847.1 hypothetical protein F8B77_03940 [Aliivibrio finisterrensis]